MIPAGILNGVKTLAIVCTQWGDTGKGKFVDIFSEWADIIARGTGGANAGHTIVIGAKTHVFHLVPSGILRDGDGKTNIIGSGVAFDPRVFTEELAILERDGASYNHLAIAMNAHLVLPQHILMDRLRERSAGDARIGTTGRGIGPAYVDHYARVGLTLNDMLNPDCFAAKLKRNIAEKQKVLERCDPEFIRGIMQHEHLESGAFYRASGFLDVDAIIERYRQYGKALRAMIRDTDRILQDAVGKKNILLEGAQGNLLSVDSGTYPYVTSSDCSVQGLARGVGILERHIDLALGIVKAFYMTRVGEGPFPTELGGDASARWCNDPLTTARLEAEEYAHASVNSSSPFLQGIGIRRAGNEYGATTRRPRRVGWLDLPLLCYSKRSTGPHVVLSKLDVLDQCATIRICDAYRYNGPPYAVGQRTLTAGDVLETAIPDPEVMRHCSPQYRGFAGWQRSIGGMKTADELPDELVRLIEYVACVAKLNIRMISVGPERDQTVTIEMDRR